MRMKSHPPHFLRHPDAHPLRRAFFADQRIRTFHQPPFRIGRRSDLAPEYEDRLAHPALDIDAMHIADFREDALGLIQWMPELAQRDKVIGDRKFFHSIQLNFHNKISVS